MGSTELLGQIASTGIVGIFCVIALVVAWKKDDALTAEKEARRVDQERFRGELSAEKQARIDDAQKASATSLALQREAIVAITALAKATEHVEAEAEARERLEREVQLRVTTPQAIPVQTLRGGK